MHSRKHSSAQADLPQRSAQLVRAPVLADDGTLRFTETPRAVIDCASWQAIVQYTRLCDTEIKGRGTVDVIGGDLLLGNPFLLEQHAGATHVEDSSAFNAFYARLARQGRERDISRYCLEWHSHVHMPPEYSETDYEAIAGYALMFDWMVSLVLNKRAEHACRLDIYSPMRLSLALPLYVALPAPPADIDLTCRNEIKKHLHAHYVLPAVFRGNTETNDSQPVLVPAEQVLAGAEKESAT